MITDDIKAALEGTTPGPWYFHDGGPYTHVRAEADRILICQISWHYSTRRHHPLKPESLANTNLIAAAPDLLTRALSEIESLQAQLRAYGDQRAAEARELMREECIAICDSHAESCEELKDTQGMKTADRIADEIRKLK